MIRPKGIIRALESRVGHRAFKHKTRRKLEWDEIRLPTTTPIVRIVHLTKKVVEFDYTTSSGGAMSENKPVPPFIEKAPSEHQKKTIQTMRPMMMVIGSFTLFISMVGGGKLLWEILIEGLPSIDMLSAKLLWVVIPFLVGWIVSLIDIRMMHNLVLPLIIRCFIWVTLFGILAIYVRIVNRLYTEAFFVSHYLRYSLVLAAGFSLLVGLHLLIEDHDLRPYSMPILVMALIHLLVAVFHYVFQDGDPAFVMGDVTYFFLMLFICILMALHLGVLNPFRRSVDRLFQRAEENMQS